MTDKVLCPYCGSEMWFPKTAWKMETPVMEGYKFHARGKCLSCDSLSPVAYGYKENETRELARTVASARYTPPQKPMSFEAVLATDAELWMEERNEGAVWACRCFFNGFDKKITAQYIASYPQEFDYADYGRTWRCWFQRPTKKQMEAATWNN